MKKYFSIVTIAITILSCGNSDSYDVQIKKYEELYNQASTFIVKNEYTNSIRLLDEAIEITDTISKALLLRGDCFYNIKKYEKAEEDFSDVIEIEGETSIAYKNRAINYLSMGDHNFIDDIDTYLSYHGDDEEALLLRRDYNVKNEDFSEAIEDLSKVINLNPKKVELFLKRSSLYEKKGDYNEAIADLSKVIGNEPKNIELYLRRINLYVMDGAYEEAIKDCSVALKIEPNNTSLQLKESSLKATLGKNIRNRNLIILLLGIYLIYLLISIKVLKPIVLRKAKEQIGGKYIVSHDPMIWVLPIIFCSVFIAIYYFDITL